jgi:hypothetical protein
MKPTQRALIAPTTWFFNFFGSFFHDFFPFTLYVHSNIQDQESQQNNILVYYSTINETNSENHKQQQTKASNHKKTHTQKQTNKQKEYVEQIKR